MQFKQFKKKKKKERKKDDDYDYNDEQIELFEVN